MEAELLKALRRNGVEKFDAVDQPFDPNRHQAMFQASVPGKPAGTVFVVQKDGFTLNGRVIRPAQVGVVKDD
ncbi:MAG: GrpE protein-like protein 1, mitochondrial [Olpidium bornovanus]|uniref:GrpE protein homolog n=1 Tax=Olpidium bornovanus TaxID=278681 RepID=A0A8H8A136_9FUNG|nr:MAG: GrpE protein-like protein 1, mitochondrial [Olpidium bornovanus]